MGSLCGRRPLIVPVRRIISCAAIAGCVAAASLAVHGTGQQSPGDTARRVAERLAVLRQEADTLAKQEASILNELRKLELQRQIRIEELTALEVELRTTTQQLAAATGRAEALRKSAESQQPDVERRLVRLYKMGRAGYWRLLLDVEDIQSMGRAYRTAAALTEIDRRRIAEHARTIDALEREQVTLRDRASEVTSLRRTATEARVALDKAVASRAALVKSIETRRDLATGLAAELDAAYLRLQSTIAQNPTAAAIGLPIRPFKGDPLTGSWSADSAANGRAGCPAWTSRVTASNCRSPRGVP